MNLLSSQWCVANGKFAEIDLGAPQHSSALRSVLLSGMLLKFCSASLFCLQQVGSALNPNNIYRKS